MMGAEKSPICDRCHAAEMVFCRASGEHLCDVCSTRGAAREALVEELGRVLKTWQTRRDLSKKEVLELMEDLTGGADWYVEEVFGGVRRSATQWQASSDERLCA